MGQAPGGKSSARPGPTRATPCDAPPAPRDRGTAASTPLRAREGARAVDDGPALAGACGGAPCGFSPFSPTRSARLAHSPRRVQSQRTCVLPVTPSRHHDHASLAPWTSLISTWSLAIASIVPSESGALLSQTLPYRSLLSAQPVPHECHSVILS